MATTKAPVPYRCLVISPIGSALAPVDSVEHRKYRDSMEVLGTVIEPACARFGITPVRSDRMRRPGEIPSQVYTALRDWELVIADLTNANPNVMYELMFRHLTGKCTIAIAEYERLPFDVLHIRTEQFVRTEAGLIAGRGRLEEAIEVVLSGGCDHLTVYRVFTGTVSVSADVTAPSDEQAEVDGSTDIPSGDSSAMLTEPDELGFLDILAESEEALPRLSAIIVSMTAVSQSLGEVATKSNAEVLEANASGKGGARDRLILMSKFARAIESPAADLEVLVAQYEVEIDRVDRGNSYLLDLLDADPAQRDESADFLISILRLDAATVKSLESTESLASSTANLGEISRVVRPATSRVAFSLRRLRVASEPIHRWAKRVRAMGVVDPLDVPGTTDPAKCMTYDERRRH